MNRSTLLLFLFFIVNSVLSQSITIKITKDYDPPKTSTVEGYVNVSLNLSSKSFTRIVQVGTEVNTKTGTITSIQSKDLGIQSLLIAEVLVDGVKCTVTCLYGSSQVDDTYSEMFGGGGKPFTSIEYKGAVEVKVWK